MKKCVTLALAAVLLTQLLLPSFAAQAPTEVTETGEAQMQISTTATAQWMLSFPADVQIPWESAAYDIGAVQAESLRLAPHAALAVSVSSAHGFKLVHESDAAKQIAYTLLTDGQETQSLRFEPGEAGKSVPLSVKISDRAWKTAFSGRHADTLTFTVSYENA